MSKPTSLLVLVGTRPEAIKLAPVVQALRTSKRLAPRVCITGQHATMAQEMLAHFKVKVDASLPVQRTNSGLTSLAGEVMTALASEIATSRPDAILVQGDTTSAMLGAMAGFYESIPVFHVEAGLRSFDMLQPYPEEFNRRVISLTAALHFCPSPLSRRNLLAEGVKASKTYIVGNTCIDALFWTLKNTKKGKPIFRAGSRGILVTGHRRENWRSGLASMCRALKQIAQLYEDVDIVYAVHPNPLVKSITSKILEHCSNVRLISPLCYADFCKAMRDSYLIISDSGGVQEEALALGTPVLVTRKVTERPEVLNWDTVRLVGTNPQKIIAEASELLDDRKYRNIAARPHFPFGKGDAAAKIAAQIQKFFQHI